MRRIVLDTNCLLISLSSHTPYHKIWIDFLEGKVEWCISTEILSEYMEILEQKTTRLLAESVVNTIVNNENAIRISPTYFFKLIETDPDDNKFVDCAICGNAEYIVTNDTHFSILKTIPFPKISIK
ncbi:MAG TPA: putative toxin-antitoxin system toxin component, PIN family, partial [Porphyromonadaceae bacterium]|nr:putative toxin-antitoxin system toxin component, PIN family [Porphyromonadaceae bacterium]